MATPNPPSPSVADAEPRPAPDEDTAVLSATQPLAVAAKGGRRLGMNRWQEYTFIGSGITMPTGLLMLLFWTSAPNSPALLLAGCVLFLAGFLGWWGMFLFLTWRLARRFLPPPVRRLLNGVRDFLPSSAYDVVDK